MTTTSSPAEPPESTLAAVLAEHVRLSWADRPYTCSCEPGASDGTGPHHLHVAAAILAATPTATHVEAGECGCPPCPGRGNDGHGMTHCAECCFGTGVEGDPDCPVHGETAARVAHLEAKLGAVVFRVEVACDGYSALTEADVPESVYEVDDYRQGAVDASLAIRAALTPPQPAP